MSIKGKMTGVAVAAALGVTALFATTGFASAEVISEVTVETIVADCDGPTSGSPFGINGNVWECEGEITTTTTTVEDETTLVGTETVTDSDIDVDADSTSEYVCKEVGKRDADGNRFQQCRYVTTTTTTTTTTEIEVTTDDYEFVITETVESTTCEAEWLARGGGTQPSEAIAGTYSEGDCVTVGPTVTILDEGEYTETTTSDPVVTTTVETVTAPEGGWKDPIGDTNKAGKAQGKK